VTAKLANTGWGQGTKITPAHLNSHSWGAENMGGSTKIKP
jgi:hypothetical protein